jgi:hypothetical protein
MRLVFSYSKKSTTHILNAFLYEKKLPFLTEREMGFSASYKQSFDEKNFKNARDMKIAVEQAKADILAHQ